MQLEGVAGFANIGCVGQILFGITNLEGSERWDGRMGRKQIQCYKTAISTCIRIQLSLTWTEIGRDAIAELNEQSPFFAEGLFIARLALPPLSPLSSSCQGQRRSVAGLAKEPKRMSVFKEEEGVSLLYFCRICGKRD